MIIYIDRFLKKKLIKYLLGNILLVLLCILATAGTAEATQAHADPEGLYVHQIAHLFFIVSLSILIYRLRQRRLVRQAGWRYIQYAAALLIIWSADAFLVHLLNQQTRFLRIESFGLWRLKMVSQEGFRLLEPVYYVARLDHLWCVPALFFLYLGLKRLARANEEIAGGNDRP